MLKTNDNDVGNPGERAAALARCYLALGRLDGAVTHAAPAVLSQFALTLVRQTLTHSLTAAGYLFTDKTFEAWLCRAGGPPPGGPGTAAPAPAIAVTVLAELRRSRWQAMADAAALVWRAMAHLGRATADSAEDQGGSEEARREGQELLGQGQQVELAAVVDAARQLLAQGSEAATEAPPLAVVLERLRHASAAFAPIERGATVIETNAGALSVPIAMQQAHHWALGLILGEVFVDQGVLRWPLPLAGAIAAEVLRRDCEADERELRLARDIGHVAHDLLAELDTARRLVERCDSALADARSTSRAPAAFALIAGVGVLTRSQVADAFGMTAAGSDGVLAKLLAAELIARRPGRAGGFCVAAVAAPALRKRDRGDSALPPSVVGDFEAAIVDLDRLLGRLPA